MTRTIDQKSAFAVPPCPTWCQDDTQGHREQYDGDPFDSDRENIRQHIVEYDDMYASTDRPRAGEADHRTRSSAWV